MSPPEKPIGLNKQELATINATSGGNFFITLSCWNDKFWRAVVSLPQTGLEYPVATARGEIKTWRNPSDAVLFLQNVCPDCNDVLIKFGRWNFTTSEKARGR